MHRFLLVDDHSIVITGLRLIIGQEFPGSLIESAQDGDTTIEKVKKTKFDVIVMDVNMDCTNVPAVIENIFRYDERARILIFTIGHEEVFAKKFFRLGVMGYLNKDCSDADVIEAIKTVMEGKKYISENLSAIFTSDGRTATTSNPFDVLSDRELDIALLIIKGKSLSDISKILNLHTSTVGTHKSRIFEKLNITHVLDLIQLGKKYNIY